MELVMAILLGLPMQHLFTLMRTSKSWKELISSHTFALLHSNSWPFRSSSLTFESCALFRRDWRMMLLSDLGRGAMHRGLEIEGSWKMTVSHGIVCCMCTGRKNFEMDAFTILNPITGKYTFLPSLSGSSVLGFGFCFDPRSCNFMVLAIQDWRDYPNGSQIEGRVFDSSTGRWTKLSHEFEFDVSLIWWSMVSIGLSCWCLTRYDGYAIGFDIAGEKTDKVIVRTPLPLSPGFPTQEPQCRILDWEGHVSIARVDTGMKLQVWVLNQGNIWQEVLNLDLSGVENNWVLNRSPKPYGPALLLGHMLVLHLFDRLMIFDMRSGGLFGLINGNGYLDHNYLPFKPTLFSWDYGLKIKTVGSLEGSDFFSSCFYGDPSHL
ncbi:hypothetical protein AMTR_s00024p00152860 [Amborella trichopoda]|uniref:F-box domain-containing protein n=1 Tax=Amborella trichopoda TaxID=13333 RepID=W1PTS3_AMBTC|nr:hypothetical protein AMTR_s00024p00152860 [Amborella trichopoda]